MVRRCVGWLALSLSIFLRVGFAVGVIVVGNAIAAAPSRWHCFVAVTSSFDFVVVLAFRQELHTHSPLSPGFVGPIEGSVCVRY